MRHEAESLDPYFPKTISCLAPLPGETGRSGRNAGSDGIGKIMIMTIPNGFRKSHVSVPGF